MLELAMTIQSYLVTCIKIIQRIGFTEKFHTDAYGNILEFKSSIPLIHPYRHVPTTNTKMTSTVIQWNGTLFQYKNKCIMFRYSQEQVVVPNTYASLLQKMMKKLFCCSN